MGRLNLNQYQRFVKESLKHKAPSKEVLVFGINSELGSIYSCIKKRIRDKTINEVSRNEIKEELGDMLWYITAICCERNFKLNKVLINNLERIKNNSEIIFMDNPKLVGADLSELKNMVIPSHLNYFSEYQNNVKKYIIGGNLERPSQLFDFCYPLTKIEHDIYEAFYSNKFKNLKNRIGDFCWYLSVLAEHYQISMDNILTENKKKVSNIFGKKISHLKNNFFDKDYDITEQLPRKFTAHFYNKDSKISYVVINSMAIGEPLDDNSYDGDKYRYHDGIHFTLYAMLGWSPVWRGFLHKKRKSNKKIDKVEDGARAKIVEEMIVKMIHSYFSELDKNQQEKSVNFTLLKQISLLSKGLEIKSITYSQWEEVILRSQEIFNLLDNNNGGKLIVDLKKRTIQYCKLTKKEKEEPFKIKK